MFASPRRQSPFLTSPALLSAELLLNSAEEVKAAYKLAKFALWTPNLSEPPLPRVMIYRATRLLHISASRDLCDVDQKVLHSIKSTNRVMSRVS